MGMSPSFLQNSDVELSTMEEPAARVTPDPEARGDVGSSLICDNCSANW